MRTICLVLLGTVTTHVSAPASAQTMAEVVAASKPSDWRVLDASNTLYLELADGRVVIELTPAFAPRHTANIRRLVRAHHFDGAEIQRVQDNFVVQWSHADPEQPHGKAQNKLPPEFSREAAGLAFTALPDSDTYAPQTGFVSGFPAARDDPGVEAWLVHCYGMVGAGRDNDADSSDGTELYVVIGHAPRQLDRNITLVGRVVQGMERLSSLPRGTGNMGFYERPEQRIAIRQIRLAADLPEEERTHLEVLRTDTATFRQLIESRRNRRDEWYKRPAGRIDVCNVPLPVRTTTGTQ